MVNSAVENGSRMERISEVIPTLVHSRCEMAGRCFYLLETVDNNELHIESDCREYEQGEVLYLVSDSAKVVGKKVMKQLALPKRWDAIKESMEKGK